MSGVLLSVAFYALIRYRVIAVTPLSSPGFVRTLLLAVALASLALAASLLSPSATTSGCSPTPASSTWAWSPSALAIGTPLAIAAVLLHILGHGLGKAVLFCGAGQVLRLRAHHPDRRRPRAARPTPGARRAPSALGFAGAPRACRRSACSPASSALARAAAAAGLGWAIAVALPCWWSCSSPITVQLRAACSSGPARRRPGPPDDCAGAIASRGSASSRAAGRGAASALALLGVVAWPLDQLLHAAEPDRRHPMTAPTPRAGRYRESPPDRRSPRPSSCRDVTAACSRTGFRLALVAAHEDRDRYRVVYLFVAGRTRPPGRARALHRPRRRPRIPSLAAVSFPAGRFEREMRDLYGIDPVDHPAARAAGPPPALAPGLVPDARRRRTDPPPFGHPTSPTRSSPSRAPASTRSPSDPSTPG